MHLTGYDLFAAHRGLLRHESLVDPLLFAGELIRTRNRILSETEFQTITGP